MTKPFDTTVYDQLIVMARHRYSCPTLKGKRGCNCGVGQKLRDYLRGIYHGNVQP